MVKWRFTIAVALLALGACGDSTGPMRATGHFGLQRVDDARPPALLSVTADFDGVTETWATAARIRLMDEGRARLTVSLREVRSGTGGNRTTTRTVTLDGRYELRGDTLQLCWRCGGEGESSTHMLARYTPMGFTLPLLFDTGEFRRYRFARIPG